VKQVFRITGSRRLLSVVALLVPVLVPITVELSGADDRPFVLPVATEHRYRMLAKVRPLLVWISRDNVGDARITRRSDGAGSMSFELLVRSDPARAPRHINRWGYLAEQVAGGQATVLGVMKQSNEQSIQEAEGRLTAESGSGTYRETTMPDTSNENQIRTLMEDWAAAVRSKDMTGALAQHADDIVMFDVPLPLQSRGLDEYEKTWELFFANNRGGPGSFELTDLRITAGDTVAYCHALLKIFDSRARLTMGLRKERGQWLIAHEHHSYPLT